MNEREKIAITAHMEELLEELRFDAEAFRYHLVFTNAISYSELETIQSQSSTSSSRLLSLLRILTTKDNGFNSLISFLQQKGSSSIAMKIIKFTR